MKYKAPKPDIRFREERPIVTHKDKGVLISCPFCNPTHPILPGMVSPCGTTLKVTAIQTYLTTHATKKIHCLKCGKTGGEMTPYRNGYVHINECAPGVKLLTEIPPFSRMAKIIYKLPTNLRNAIEKMTGKTKELQEIDAEGKQTGNILGYFFWKG